MTVEVHHRPRQTAAALLVPRDPDAVLPLLQAFEAQAGATLTAFEGMSEGRHGAGPSSTCRRSAIRSPAAFPTTPCWSS